MHEDSSTPDAQNALTDDAEPTDGGKLDDYDDAVIAADDTGMLSGERFITAVEIEEGLDGR